MSQARFSPTVGVMLKDRVIRRGQVVLYKISLSLNLSQYKLVLISLVGFIV